MADAVTEHYADDGPYPGAGVGEVVKATVDTDGSGNGSITGISTLAPYSASPVAVMGEESDAAATVANVTRTSFDISVSGSSTTSGTVTVHVLLRGPGGGA